tara:strand:- start:40 stop:918 length:879 start_codon:yes stop_codon:yes gene_type:complete
LKIRNKFFFLLFFFLSCNKYERFDVQGHRGARGLYPENSIIGFIKSIEMGVNTIELDVVISKDRQVVVSHEPWISHTICVDSLGLKINDDFNKYNIFKMNYNEIKKFDCGSIKNPKFLSQENSFVSKPLLREVLIKIENYVKENNIENPNYNIEIKSNKKGDNIFHPSYEIFSDLVYREINNLISKNRIVIQSFDFRVLKYFNKKYPNIKISVLVNDNYNPKNNLMELGFIPDIYSPNYNKLNKMDVLFLKEKKIDIIPWTVNSYDDIAKVLELGVDGIISDYPNRVLDLLE